MPISKEQKDIAVDYLNNYGGFKCALCGGSHIEVNDIVGCVHINEEVFDLKLPGVKMVQTICTDCGKIEFIAAQPMGL